MSSVTFRMATLDEVERTGTVDGTSLIDGAGAVLSDGELLGLTNEYGTCVWHAPGVSAKDVEAAAHFCGSLMAAAHEGRLQRAGQQTVTEQELTEAGANALHAQFGSDLGHMHHGIAKVAVLAAIDRLVPDRDKATYAQPAKQRRVLSQKRT
jgi:hypothetical protein